VSRFPTARHLAGLAPYQPGKPVEELEREFGIVGAVKLASNENPLGPSPRAIVALTSAAGTIHRYPDGGSFRLRRRLAQRYGVGDEEVAVGSGSNELLTLIARTYLEAGTNAVASRYGFIVYKLATHMAGGELREVADLNYSHDLQAMAEAVDHNTRIVFVANPNNPTGTYHNGEDLVRFLKRIPSHVLVVLDEAYVEYITSPMGGDGVELRRRFSNLVVTRTFSKAYGLAGMRIGYMIADPEVIQALNTVRDPFNVNLLAQEAAIAALGDEPFLERVRHVNRQGRLFLQERLRQMAIDWIPGEGNFLTLDLKRPAGAIEQAMLRQGVIVRGLVPYDMPNHLRMSIGLQEENERAIAALAQALATD